MDTQAPITLQLEGPLAVVPLSRAPVNAIDEAWLAGLDGALDTLARWFGPLATSPRVTLIEIPEGWGSQASLSAGIILEAPAFRERGRLRELYHELTHFWNPVDTAAFSPRLNEGLASLMERRLAAVIDGWPGLDSLVLQRAASLVERATSDSVLRTTPLSEYGAAQRTDLSYPVGMLFLHSLQQCLGESAFDALWAAYLQRTWRTGGSDRDFAAFAVERGERPEVQRLFQTWFFTTGWLDRLRAEDPHAVLGDCGVTR